MKLVKLLFHPVMKWHELTFLTHPTDQIVFVDSDPPVRIQLPDTVNYLHPGPASDDVNLQRVKIKLTRAFSQHQCDDGATHPRYLLPE
jgi:hypothetical protein